MAENPLGLLKSKHESAVIAVRTALEKRTGYTLVSPKESGPLLAACSAVWRRAIQIGSREWVVDVGLPSHFPDEVPIAYSADWKELHLRNPHVVRGGFLCTIPNSAATNSSDPVGLIERTFLDAEQILAGTDSADFQKEFSYYWNQSVTDTNRDVLIVDSAEHLTNPFPAVFCEGFICAASSKDRLSRWALNRIGSPKQYNFEELGVTIRLNAPLVPEAYPNSLEDLLSIARKNDGVAAQLIEAHIVNSAERGLALLIQKEGDGFALGGISFNGFNLKKSAFIPGFRPGKAPADLLIRRASARLKSEKINRHAVTRVDHHWIHSRGGDGRDLSGKSVLLIGCGSLGGYVAHLLSRVGVGKITVTDNDKLGWENLGRHILGADSIGEWKAEALAKLLNKQLPHLEIKGINSDWRYAFAEDHNLFSRHDLVISTVADWKCEKPLNELTRKAKMPPVLFGWLEPHAVAGHCLSVADVGGCFECSTNVYGQFSHAVAVFSDTTISKEPGGCTHYQHYGPTALMPVASMIATKAVNTLLTPLNSSHLTTWISSDEHLHSVEAKISTAWMADTNNFGFSRTFHKSWPKSIFCPLCSQLPE